MYSWKDKPELFARTPYSRVNTRKPEVTVEKILSKPRTSENNYGRNFPPTRSHPVKNFQSRNIQMFNDDDQGAFNENYAESVRSGSDFEPGQFRPRRSQLNRTKDRSPLTNVSLEMMNIGEATKSSENPRQKLNSIQETDSSKGIQIKPRENLFRLFTGSVENLLYWFRLRNNFQILFEVTATLDEIQLGKWQCEKILFLSDSRTGPSLQVLYYEIDRPLPKLSIKSTVTCIGRLITRNRLHAFKVEESSEEKKHHSNRLAFICNRVAEEIFASTQKK